MRTFFVRHGSLVRRWSYMLAALLAIVPAVVMADSTEEEVTAVWKAQQVSFEYRGYSTMYSCRSLEDKLEIILRTVGARENVRLESYVCDEQLGIARFQISMQSPVIASEENVRELTTHDSKDELVARVNGAQLPSAADLERFPAVWKKVSFARDRYMRLERGDCELVEQLRRQILPRMSVQVVKDNIRCSSAFGNIGSPRLIVSALVPAKDPLKR
ncbi:hypothetical protein GCM10011487_00670 [Steroidobacter agaridevorans]|uniref:Uncharacterized protein n=1 Tax=Steroidobacter agaridevorans TaxID=2695856 RepID=A0A829Y4G8_9GAMM|nr:hypothetical protein [Steroidobacter agaridevorans]GFE78067.1 hypothetical protein GCM10011487_00670 [Steroidobacter agaridevorans]